MQKAARACPASAPCPDHDARTRVCAGAENRTRNALRYRKRANTLSRNASAAVRRGAPGLLPAARARSLRSLAGVQLNGTSFRPEGGLTPHDSMTSKADLVEESVNCKRSRCQIPAIKARCGLSATKFRSAKVARAANKARFPARFWLHAALRHPHCASGPKKIYCARSCGLARAALRKTCPHQIGGRIKKGRTRSFIRLLCARSSEFFPSAHRPQREANGAGLPRRRPCAPHFPVSCGRSACRRPRIFLATCQGGNPIKGANRYGCCFGRPPPAGPQAPFCAHATGPWRHHWRRRARASVAR
jgi:hypothetical protein